MADFAGATYAENFTITVTNANDGPTAISLSPNSVAENAAAGSMIGTLTTTDQDAGETFSYLMTDTAGGRFRIGGGANNEVRVDNASLLNFEANTSHQITVQVTDSGGLNFSQNLTINVTNVNEQPTAISLSENDVDENAASASMIGTLTTTDPDTGDTFTYVMTDTAGGRFRIGGANNNEVRVDNGALLNFEANTSHQITVQSTDSGGLNVSQNFTIVVNNVNEAPVVQAATFSVAENSANGTSVGTVSFNDPDTGQSHSYAITGGNTGGAFAINGTTGAITVANSAALNFEATTSFGLTVTVTDNGSPVQSGSATITVNLTNVNEAPVVNDQSFSIPENSANATAVGTVAFTEPDAGQTQTWLIVTGNTGGAFAINPSTGAITVANSAALDFETNPSFSLTVQVTDNGTPNLTDTATVTITLTNVNEAPVVNDQAFSVAENSANGTAVGTVAFTEPDASQTHTFAITNGNTGGAFAINLTTGAITVANGSLLDREATPSYTLTVQVTDDGTPNLSDTATVTVTVTNVNEQPTALALSNNVVDETIPVGTVVGLLSTTDPDVGDTFTYTITSDPDDKFTIVGNELRTDERLDFETETSHEVTIQSADSGSLTVSQLFTITVNDVVIESLSPTAGDQSVSTPEETGLTITLSATDPDGDDLTFSIVSGQGPSHGTLGTIGTVTCVGSPSTCTADVLYTPALNYVGPDSFVWRADDLVSAPDDGTISITVTAVNDAPVLDAVETAVLPYTENGAATAITGALTVADVDSPSLTGATVKITGFFQAGADVLALPSPVGSITGSFNGVTGVLTLTGSGTLVEYQTALRSVTFENTSDSPAPTARTIELQVNDGSALSNLSNVESRQVTVTPVNDAPELDAIEATALSYNEGAAATAISTAITVIDDDNASLTGATVQITGGYVQGEDVLGFTSPTGSGIGGSFNAMNGTMTLTGTSSVANYQLALRAVNYSNNDDTPTTDPRTVSFQVNDGQALTNLSNIETRGITVVPVNDPPTGLAAASHAVTGNVRIQAPDNPNDLLVGVTDPEGDTFVAQVDPTNASAGNITISANGSYTFNPKAGREGADTVKFRVCDTGTPVACSAPQNLTLNVSGMIWFIDNSLGTNGDGRLTSPFNTLPAFVGINNGTGDNPNNGDVIFIARQVATAYTGPLTLRNDQKVIGQGATVGIAAFAGITLAPDSDALPTTSGTNPTITTTTGTLNGITLGSTNSLRGLTVGAKTGTGISGSSFGTLTVQEVSITGAGAALALNNGTVATGSTFTEVSSTSSGSPGAVHLQTVNGSFTVSGGSITGPSNSGIAVLSSGVSFSWAGNVSKTAGTSALVTIGSHTGTLTFSGTLSATNAGGLTFNNADGAYTFSGTTTLSGTPDPAGNEAAINIFGGSSGTFNFGANTTITNPVATSFQVSIGSPNVTYSGSMSRNTVGYLIFIAGQTGGTITFQTGTLAATAGEGIVLSDADGTVNFTGTTTLNGGIARVAVLNGSNGTINFGANTTITHADPGSNAFGVTSSAPSLIYSGNITKTGGGNAVTISGQASSARQITFQTGTINATAGDGIMLSDADGTVSFNGTTTLNGGNAGVDIANGSSGTFVFGSNTTITNPTGTAFHVNGGSTAVSANVTYSGSITKNGTSAGRLVDIGGQSGGTITFQTGTLSSTSSAGTGIQLSNADGTVNFNGTTTLNGGDAGIDVSGGSGGTIKFADGTGSAGITNPSGEAITILSSSPTFTYAGTFSKTNGGRGIFVNNNNGGTIVFSGTTKTITTTGSNRGVDLTSNTGATINFTGGNLIISTDDGNGFHASGGGTVTVTGSNNTIASTGGVALNVSSTAIGSNGLTFKSIAANGGTNGIVLNTTGTSGGLTVSGDGGGSNNGSGGTIQNTTGTAAILLNSASNVNLGYMNVQNSPVHGISSTSVTGFTLTRSAVSNNGNAVNEHGITFSQLLGTASITNSTVSGNAENDLIITNTSGTLTLTVTGSTFSNTSGTVGNDGIHISANDTAGVTVSVTGSTFNNNRGDHFQFSTNATSLGTNSVTFSNNTLTGAAGNLGAGITISPDAASDTTFTIANNNIQGAISHAIAVAVGAASVPGGVTSGTISGNTIGNAAVVDSGSAQATGIAAYADGDGVLTIGITNNQIRQWSGFAGIDVLIRDGSPTLNATITGNTVAIPGTFGGNGLLITAGAITTDAGTVCAAITGNTLAGSGGSGTTDFRLRQRFLTTVRLPGYGGAAGDTAAVVSFVQGNNPGAETGSATANFPVGGGGFVGGAVCTLP